MVSRTFKIKKKELEKKPITIFQHKLRVLMKCYTIRDLSIDEVKQKYKFKKSHKINGLKFDDSKEYFGSYEVKEVEGEKDVYLTLSI